MDSFDYILDIDPNAKVKTFKKGTIIQRAGDIKAYTYFVRKGLLRCYLIDSKGKEHIFSFCPENWVTADVEALEFEEPVQLFIDCLEDSEVVIFDHHCILNPEFPKEKMAQSVQLLYRRVGRLQRRVLMLMGSPAIDRYRYFNKIFPDLQNRVPQRMIATYLGITPQALSTLRGKIAKEP